jgi:hypothetical protein
MPKRTESAVSNYIAGLPAEMSQIARSVRRLILSACPGIAEELKWGRPWFAKNGRICYLAAHRRHVTLGLARGTSLDDPDHLLEGTGKAMRHVKLRAVKDIRRARFAQWVRTIARLNEEALAR